MPRWRRRTARGHATARQRTGSSRSSSATRSMPPTRPGRRPGWCAGPRGLRPPRRHPAGRPRSIRRRGRRAWRVARGAPPAPARHPRRRATAGRARGSRQGSHEPGAHECGDGRPQRRHPPRQPERGNGEGPGEDDGQRGTVEQLRHRQAAPVEQQREQRVVGVGVEVGHPLRQVGQRGQRGGQRVPGLDDPSDQVSVVRRVPVLLDHVEPAHAPGTSPRRRPSRRPHRARRRARTATPGPPARPRGPARSRAGRASASRRTPLRTGAAHTATDHTPGAGSRRRSPRTGTPSATGPKVSAGAAALQRPGPQSQKQPRPVRHPEGQG